MLAIKNKKQTNKHAASIVLWDIWEYYNPCRTPSGFQLLLPRSFSTNRKSANTQCKEIMYVCMYGGGGVYIYIYVPCKKGVPSLRLLRDVEVELLIWPSQVRALHSATRTAALKTMQHLPSVAIIIRQGCLARSATVGSQRALTRTRSLLQDLKVRAFSSGPCCCRRGGCFVYVLNSPRCVMLDICGLTNSS